MMKSTLHWLQALFLVLGFLVPQAVHARGGEATLAGSAGSKEVPMENLRSPKWNNSLQGYGSLNLTRGSVTDQDGTPKTESQVGPIRFFLLSETQPASFTGSLSRVVSNPSYNPNY